MFGMALAEARPCLTPRYRALPVPEGRGFIPTTHTAGLEMRLLLSWGGNTTEIPPVTTTGAGGSAAVPQGQEPNQTSSCLGEMESKALSALCSASATPPRRSGMCGTPTLKEDEFHQNPKTLLTPNWGSPEHPEALPLGMGSCSSREAQVGVPRIIHPSIHPTCVPSQGSSRDDRLVLVHVGPVPHIVLEGALGLVAGQGGRVVLGVEAVVGRDALQALEGGLAAPGLRQAVAAVVALDALEGVLASQLTWRGHRG